VVRRRKILDVRRVLEPKTLEEKAFVKVLQGVPSLKITVIAFRREKRK